MVNPITLFFSYAEPDEGLFGDLGAHLANLEHQGEIAIANRKVAPGQETSAAMAARLGAADVIVLLVSAQFFASSRCSAEMSRALERARAGSARVIPVLARPCDFPGAPFDGLRVLPDGGRPVTSWPDADQAWTSVARGIREVTALIKQEAAASSRASMQVQASPAARSRRALFEGPGAVPANAVPHFTGRADELLALRSALSGDAEAVCVVASGIGGIGKTSLAQQFVYAEAESLFPEGSLWIDAMALPSELARSAIRFGWLDDRPPTVDEANTHLSITLRDRAVLIVIDNVDAERVDPTRLPVVGGASRTLITSRSPTLYEDLGKLAVNFRLERWSQDTCRAYLRKVVPGLASTPSDELDPLTKFVDGLPLAVRLIARLLLRPGATPRGVLARLEREPLGTLDSVAKGADRGVAATFLSAWSDLDEPRRRVSTALAACAQSTSTSIVAEVAGLPLDVTEELLSDIGARSLVEFTGTSDRPWRLHDVVRLFLRRQQGAAEAQERHGEVVLAMARAHSFPAAWASIDRDLPEVLAALDRLLAAKLGKQSAELFIEVVDHLGARGAYVEVSDRLRRLLDLVPAQSREAAITHLALALCHRLFGDLDEARARSLNAIAICQALELLGVEARSFCELASIQIELGQLNEAEESGNCSLAICKRTDSKGGEARALRILASCYAERDVRTALGYLQQARTLDEQLKDRLGEAASLSTMAYCFVVQNDLETAIQYYQRSLEIYTSVGMRWAEADTLGALGDAYRRTGDVDAAIAMLGRALSIDEKLNRKLGQASNLGRLGLCFKAKGDLERALEHYHKALAISESMTQPASIARLLANLGTCYFGANDPEQAIDCHRKALAIYEQIGAVRSKAKQLEHIGDCLRRELDYKEAIVHYNRATALYVDIKDERGESDAIASVALCLEESGREAEAIAIYQRALAIRERLGNTRLAARIHSAIGRCQKQSRELGLARTSVGLAIAMNRSIGARRSEAYALMDLADILVLQRAFAEARTNLEKAQAIAEELDDPKAKADVLWHSGTCSRASGDITAAISNFIRANELNEELDDRARLVNGLVQLAECYRIRRDLDAAIATLERAIDLGKKLPPRNALARPLDNLSRWLVDAGKKAESVEPLTELLALDIYRDRPAQECAVRLRLAKIYINPLADFDMAEEHLTRALALAEREGNDRLQTQSEQALGDCIQRRGDLARAVQHYLRAVDRGKQWRGSRWHVNILCRAAYTAGRALDFSLAKMLCERALKEGEHLTAGQKASLAFYAALFATGEGEDDNEACLTLLLKHESVWKKRAKRGAPKTDTQALLEGWRDDLKHGCLPPIAGLGNDDLDIELDADPDAQSSARARNHVICR